MKTIKSLTTLLLLTTLNSQAGTLNEVYMKASDSHVSFDWSIDNSDVGGVSKASEITWETDVNLITIGKVNQNGYSEMFIGVSDRGDMIDKDWDENGLWSDTKSDIEYKTIGFTQSNNSHYAKDISISTNYTLQYERWDALGLYDTLYQNKKYKDSTLVMGMDSFTYSFGIKPEYTKVFNRHKFNIGLGLHLTNKVSLDHHYLRTDLKDNSFWIVGIYGGYNFDVNYSYELTQYDSIKVGFTKNYTDLLLGTIFVNKSGSDESTRLGINGSTSGNNSLYLQYNIKW